MVFGVCMHGTSIPAHYLSLARTWPAYASRLQHVHLPTCGLIQGERSGHATFVVARAILVPITPTGIRTSRRLGTVSGRQQQGNARYGIARNGRPWPTDSCALLLRRKPTWWSDTTTRWRYTGMLVQDTDLGDTRISMFLYMDRPRARDKGDVTKPASR